MGEIQEQKYVCKICSKSCVSGKSLGGHMRAHLALISASKKAAKIKIDDDQSNSALLIEEKINDCDFGDGDQSSNYELRENPKKSWRISFSDVKNGVMMNSNSCKECGKEFPSSRALSGHMRCHSIKNNKEVHHCKDCGKGFDSVKAMFGHMKTHSKKSREARNYAESLSDLDSFCPVRRKRSRIRYKTGPNPSVSDVNVSKNSTVSELGDAEEVAMCLIMLSRGVRDSLKVEKESDDDDSVCLGGESSARSRKFCRNGGDFLSDVEKKTSLLTEKLDRYSSGDAYPFSGMNVPEFDDLDSEFVAEDPSNDDTEVCDEIKIDFDRVLKPEKCHELDGSRSVDCNKSAEFDEGFMVAADNNEGPSGLIESNFGKKANSSVDESGFEMTSSENETKLESLKHFEKKPECKQRASIKIIHSHSLLEGQNGRQKVQGNSPAVNMNASLSSVTEDDSKLESTSEGDMSLESSKSKEYQCLICFKVFSSGQALGGHKRAHYNGCNESKNQEFARVENALDLNLAASVDEGIKSEVKLSSWWMDRCHDHEATSH